MIMGCILDYYIIHVLLLKVATKGKGWYIICKTKKKQIIIIITNWINKKVDKFGFVASLT
jgi:hypothetical protein